MWRYIAETTHRNTIQSRENSSSEHVTYLNSLFIAPVRSEVLGRFLQRKNDVAEEEHDDRESTPDLRLARKGITESLKSNYMVYLTRMAFDEPFVLYSAMGVSISKLTENISSRGSSLLGTALRECRNHTKN